MDSFHPFAERQLELARSPARIQRWDEANRARKRTAQLGHRGELEIPAGSLPNPAVSGSLQQTPNAQNPANSRVFSGRTYIW